MGVASQASPDYRHCWLRLEFKVMLDVHTDKDSSVPIMSDLTSAADAMKQWPLLSQGGHNRLLSEGTFELIAS